MQKKIWLIALLGLPLFSSCNFYFPLASPGSDAEYIEEARRCLHAGNFACAVENYGRISDADLKNEKLCTVNIARAGLDISSLVEVLISNQSQDDLLQLLANRLLPYTADKEVGSAEAVTLCATLPASNTATLLRALSLILDCAVRAAKTDSLVATSAGGEAECNSEAAENPDGEVTEEDIGGNVATGVLSVGEPGMCEADVNICIDNLSAASALSGTLNTADLDAIADNLDALPAALKNAATANDLGRATLRGIF